MSSNDSKVRQLSVDESVYGLQSTRKAFLIVRFSHESTASFLEALRVVRKERGAGRGALTGEEQDLLRMMVVIAAAGLDSLLKQLIRDCVPQLVLSDEKVRQGLEGFVARQLRNDASDIDSAASNKFLAKVLVAESHQSQVIEEYVRYLTGSSLQSVDQVKAAIIALGVDLKDVGLNNKDSQAELKEIFSARNRIIHELDIDFEGVGRNRRSRTINQMVSSTNALLGTCEGIINSVHVKLGGK